MLVNGSLGQIGTVGPNGGQQIHIGAQACPHLVQCLAQLCGGGQPQHRTIHTHGLPWLHSLRQPLHMVGGSTAVDFDQFNSATSEFGLGLGPVTAVGKQGSTIAGNRQGSHGTGKARQPLPPLPARRQVFRQMGVTGRHQARLQPQCCHGILGSSNALGKNVGRGGHNGSFWEGWQRQGAAQSGDCRTPPNPTIRAA